MPNLKAKEYRRFEDIKYVRQDGSEYWSARELAGVLDYSQWRNFQKVIDRAMIACENSGHEVLLKYFAHKAPIKIMKICNRYK